MFDRVLNTTISFSFRGCCLLSFLFIFSSFMMNITEAYLGTCQTLMMELFFESSHRFLGGRGQFTEGLILLLLNQLPKNNPYFGVVLLSVCHSISRIKNTSSFMRIIILYWFKFCLSSCL